MTWLSDAILKSKKLFYLLWRGVIQHAQQFPQLLFELDDHIVAAQLVKRDIDLLADAAQLLQALARAFDRVFVVVKQALDEKNELDVVQRVSPAAGAAFLRAQLGKLRFPVAQNIRFQRGDLADFADGIIELFDFLLAHGD